MTKKAKSLKNRQTAEDFVPGETFMNLHTGKMKVVKGPGKSSRYSCVVFEDGTWAYVYELKTRFVPVEFINKTKKVEDLKDERDQTIKSLRGENEFLLKRIRILQDKLHEAESSLTDAENELSEAEIQIVILQERIDDAMEALI